MVFIPSLNQIHGALSSKSEYTCRKGFLLQECSPIKAQVLQWYFPVFIQPIFQFPNKILWKTMPLAVVEEDFFSPINHIFPVMHSFSINQIFYLCHFNIPNILIKPFLQNCFLYAPFRCEISHFICPSTFLHVHGSFSFIFSEFQLNHIKWCIKTRGNFTKPLK